MIIAASHLFSHQLQLNKINESRGGGEMPSTQLLRDRAMTHSFFLLYVHILKHQQCLLLHPEEEDIRLCEINTLSHRRLRRNLFNPLKYTRISLYSFSTPVRPSREIIAWLIHIQPTRVRSAEFPQTYNIGGPSLRASECDSKYNSI